jgi:tRNA (adenine22-N1)-methyltransferase
MHSNRLTKIISMVEPCEVFYDLCCDHGKIGKSIIEQNKAKKVIFNDQVKHIIDKLRDELSAYITSDVNFLSKPCENIDIIDKSTVCIVGVGYETILKFLKNNKNKKLELIISSHTKPIELREFLINQQYHLKSEELLQENGHFYEILNLNTYNEPNISILGHFKQNNASKKYFEKLSNYYLTKVTHQNDSKSKEILKKIREKQKEF